MLSDPAEFWSGKSTPDVCWEWTHSVATEGYGQLYLRAVNRPVSSHRYAFFLTYGYWPNVCRHLCNNRLCFNPAHLADGSYQDNMDDRRAAGNFPAGEHNGAAKLTREQVREIRTLRGRMRIGQIAEKFGVKRQTITDIMQGRNWVENNS